MISENLNPTTTEEDLGKAIDLLSYDIAEDNPTLKEHCGEGQRLIVIGRGVYRIVTCVKNKQLPLPSTVHQSTHTLEKGPTREYSGLTELVEEQIGVEGQKPLIVPVNNELYHRTEAILEGANVGYNAFDIKDSDHHKIVQILSGK
ncbi:MAG: hypothetical protein KAQ83_01520 [Nanoarchaeota archaeon]|nr:hypothetical protein [Nanoarchaeota archaeon]